eukprot:scaffold37555_cov25-Cyclotella_meneghiniana.AAC.2
MLVAPGSFHVAACIPTHQPWNPLRIHRRRPPTPLNSSSPVTNTVIACVGAGFVINTTLDS